LYLLFLSLVFFVLLIFFRTSFGLYPLMSWQDALDLLTPLVLIPFYWVLFRRSGRDQSTLWVEIAFMIFAAFWVMGQGMHLSANSINNLAENLAETGVLSILDSDLYELIYFYDEYLSHYLWHIGVVGLAGVVVYREWQDPVGERTVWWAAVLGGLIYGLILFAIFVEGQTALLGVPYSILFTLFVLILGRRKIGDHPVLAFFFVSFLATALLLVGWGIIVGNYVGFGI
jgi:hypothetical protein